MFSMKTNKDILGMNATMTNVIIAHLVRYIHRVNDIDRIGSTANMIIIIGCLMIHSSVSMIHYNTIRLQKSRSINLTVQKTLSTILETYYMTAGKDNQNYHLICKRFLHRPSHVQYVRHPV